jgi:NAD(P)H-dependent FMN reductase
MPRIAIIAGSTRPNRRSRIVADWIHAIAQERADAEYEVVDLADVNLPLLDEPVPAAFGQYQQPHTKAWSQRIAAFDGFVFVTPEYNRSIPAVLKNAIDYLFAEWHDKSGGIVGYGVNGGVAAIEHLRQICTEVQLADVRTSLGLNIANDFTEDGMPAGRHRPALHQMLDEVVSSAVEFCRWRSTA